MKYIKELITYLIHLYFRCTDPCEQLAYVAAFTISSYSTTSSRTGKPFNPLLGETYECDRSDDLGKSTSPYPTTLYIKCKKTLLFFYE